MILSRKDVAAKLEDRLAGRLSAEALAVWAFDLFYELDQGMRSVAPEDAEPIAGVLDELMFADDESFALKEADLRRLLGQLNQP